MSEEIKNHFLYNRIFPNINPILQREGKSIDDIFKSAIFVLDTNALLAPFQTGKDDIEKNRKIYDSLISTNRLFIPEHVLREFAHNRSIKISELFTNIDSFITSVPTIKNFEYPILGELESYKALKETRESFGEITKQYLKQLKELKDGITNWNWSDPVTTMYSKTFIPTIIINTALKEDELIKEYNLRIEFNIPPGNKDKSKDNNAIGDFLIWKTILELGKKEEKDIVFISNDEKNDWLLKGNKQSISTKYELVHEFYDQTNGHNFICMTFSDFLKAQGLEIELVDGFDFDEFINTYNFEDNKSLTIDCLDSVYSVLVNFIGNIGTEKESIYIVSEISDQIKKFNDVYHNEYVETPYWQAYCFYFMRFSEWLTDINKYNYEILYQEHRMKRNTEGERIKMIALAKEFVSLYKQFKRKYFLFSE